MRMSIRCVSLLAFAFLSVGVARGQEMANEPFDRAWDFENSQGARGKVVSIIEETYPLNWQTQKLMDKPFATNRLGFEDGRLSSSTFIAPDGKERLDLQVKYQNGIRRQIIRFVQVGQPNGEPQVKNAYETAKLSPQGELENITIERISGEKSVVPIKIEPTADGGKKVSWSVPGPSGREPGAGGAPAPQSTTEIVLQYDKAGRLVGRDLRRDGKSSISASFTYTAQGDIETIRMGSDFRIVYEREYDSQGNWIKQTKVMVRTVGGKETRSVQEGKTRKITYAP